MAGDRSIMIEAFRRVLSDDAMATLDALVPTRPWREAIPSSFWLQPSVMATADPSARHDLHDRLVEILGVDAAGATMDHLPPVPWRVLRAHGMDRRLHV